MERDEEPGSLLGRGLDISGCSDLLGLYLHMGLQSRHPKKKEKKKKNKTNSAYQIKHERHQRLSPVIRGSPMSVVGIGDMGRRGSGDYSARTGDLHILWLGDAPKWVGGGCSGLVARAEWPRRMRWISTLVDFS